MYNYFKEAINLNFTLSPMSEMPNPCGDTVDLSALATMISERGEPELYDTFKDTIALLRQAREDNDYETIIEICQKLSQIFNLLNVTTLRNE